MALEAFLSLRQPDPGSGSKATVIFLYEVDVSPFLAEVHLGTTPIFDTNLNTVALFRNKVDPP